MNEPLITTRHLQSSIVTNGRCDVERLARHLGIWHPETLDEDQLVKQIADAMGRPRTAPTMPRQKRAKGRMKSREARAQ